MNATTILARDEVTVTGDSSPAVPEPTDSEDFGPQINICIWVLATLAAAWLALRLYCKARRNRGLWWDDYFLIAAWFALALSNSATSVAIHFGFGNSLPHLDLAKIPSILLASNLTGTFTVLGGALSKTSFALTLLRISKGWVKFLVWFIIITVNTSLLLSAIFLWAQCTPVQKTFNPLLPGTCWPGMIIVVYNVFVAAYAGAMDIVLALLPWTIIWKLEINKKERLGAIIAMSMGVFAGIISLIKIRALPGPTEADIDNSIQLVVLATAEISITIMAASIPILRALARDIAPSAKDFFTLNFTQRKTLRQRSPRPPTRPTESLEMLDPAAPPPARIMRLGWGNITGRTSKADAQAQIVDADEARSPR